MENELLNFIQNNSPDGGFLQSEYWRKFQEATGKKAYNLSETDKNEELIVCANIITHTLPIVGDYFYIPRGPVTAQGAKLKDQNYNAKFKSFLDNLIRLAGENNIGWIRVEPTSEDALNFIRENLPKNTKLEKSSVDMQPGETFVLDISRSEEEILAGMKQKTRYNIRLAEKRGVKVSVNSDQGSVINRFLELIKITSRRDKIKAHPENYYRKMFETIPPEILKLYVAEFEGKIIAANLVLFFGKTATYMHGASGDVHRDVMAPYILQWQQICDAKKAGCEQYDLGGINTQYTIHNTRYKKWAGITKFKTGFAPDVDPICFPGCYDIVLNPFKYNLYWILQKIKRIL